MQTVDFDRLLDGGDRVLDVGCGEGRHTHGAAVHPADPTVVACDLDPDRLRTARDGLRSLDDADADGDADDTDERGGTGGAAWSPEAGFVQVDAFSLPFADDAFDIVVCAEVLEHLPDYECAIDELVRVLAPGGQLAVSVPRFGPEWVCWALSDAYHAVEGGHVRIFHDDELRAALEARGLRVADADFAHALHVPYWWLTCLWWDRADAGRPPAPLAAYERFLEWVVVTETPRVDAVERALDPVLGKSRVFYCRDRQTPELERAEP